MSEFKKETRLKPKIEYKPKMKREDKAALLKAYEVVELKNNESLKRELEQK